MDGWMMAGMEVMESVAAPDDDDGMYDSSDISE